MTMNRRDLLTMSSLAAAFPVLGTLAFTTSCSAPSPEQKSVELTTADQDTYNFWANNVRNLESAGMVSRGIGNAPPRATFIYHDKDKGFVAGTDIGDDGLQDKGDLDVIVNVDHIRPSTTDQARFENLEGGSLRIDLQQSAPLPNLAERLAWTAIAGFLPENKKLPALKDMTFDPGTTWGKLQTVPLPGGGGRWTWNFFLKKKQSRWMQLFDVIRRTKNLVIPIFGLGLPAIAVTALSTVDYIVAEITKDDRTDWLFQSPDLYLYATKESRDSFEGTKLRLKQGMYALMPNNQLPEFSKEMDKLTIKDGLIVPKDTAAINVEAAAKSVITNVTYLTVGVTAKLRPTKT